MNRHYLKPQKFPFRSFQFRLLAYLLLIGSIPLVCAMFVFYQQSNSYAHKELKNHIRQTHEQMLTRIHYELNSLKGIADNMAHDYVIQEYLAEDPVMNDQDFKNRVVYIRDRMKRQSSYLSDVCIAVNEVRVCTDDSFFPRNNEENFMNNMDSYNLVYLPADRSPKEVPKILVTLVSPLIETRSDVIKGQIVVAMNAERLLSDMYKDYPSIVEHIIYQDQQVIYNYNGSKLTAALDSSNGVYPFITGHHIIDQQKMSINGLNWISDLTVQNSFLTSSWHSLRNTLMIFFGILFLLSIFSSFIFSRFVVGPLHHLRVLMKRAELGDLKAYWTNKSTLEIDHLGESYNQMLNRLEELFKQVKHEESLKKEAEIEALQYQLNPHFLYNTLNTIKWVAKIHKTPQISEVVSSLVRLLQASLGKKGDFITINEEIELIRDYMEIQAFRYGDKVEIRYEIDAIAAVCLVPRLIFQPLVENALIHGLEPNEGDGVIIIRAWIDRDLLICEVADNGRGVSEAALDIKDSLSRKGVKERMSGIGLQHIRQKIKLYYGADYKMHIYSEPNKGTIIRMSLPIHRSEEQ